MARERSAKPLYSGSNPLAASKKNQGVSWYSWPLFQFRRVLVAAVSRWDGLSRSIANAGYKTKKADAMAESAGTSGEVGTLDANGPHFHAEFRKFRLAHFNF